MPGAKRTADLYSQDFHFLLQNPQTPEGFQKGFPEGVSEGLSKGFRRVLS